MPVVNIVSDYFKHVNDNFTSQPYQKNGNVFIGEFDRESGFCREVLLFLDFTGIPAGSTINSVVGKFTIVSNTLGGSMTPKIRNQDKGTPTDDGVNSPTYAFRTGTTAWSAGAWPAEAASFPSLSGASSGTISSTTNATIEQLIQDKLDGVSPNNGLIFDGNSSFAGWWVEVNTVQLEVDYTEPSTSKMLIM